MGFQLFLSVKKYKFSTVFDVRLHELAFQRNDAPQLVAAKLALSSN